MAGLLAKAFAGQERRLVVLAREVVAQFVRVPGSSHSCLTLKHAVVLLKASDPATLAVASAFEQIALHRPGKQRTRSRPCRPAVCRLSACCS